MHIVPVSDLPEPNVCASREVTDIYEGKLSGGVIMQRDVQGIAQVPVRRPEFDSR